MKDIMISIQPKWVFLIIAHKMGWDIPQRKEIEVRKDYPKDKQWSRVTHIYCSKSKKSFKRIPKQYQPFIRKLLGKVVGSFVCDYVVDGSSSAQDWEYICENSCVPCGELYEYCGEDENGDTKYCYGWHISDLVIYDKPKELGEFIKPCPYNIHCYQCKFISRYESICTNFITRPPQSWCYVEGI